MKDSLSDNVYNGVPPGGVAIAGEGPVRIERTRYDAADLHAFVRRALAAANVRDEDADLVATVLVASDSRGIESHGVARLERFYVEDEETFWGTDGFHVEGMILGGRNA